MERWSLTPRHQPPRNNRRAQRRMASVAHVSDRLKAAIAGLETMATRLPITSAEDARAQAEVFRAVFMANVKELGGAATAEALKPAWAAFRRSLTGGAIDPEAVKEIMGSIDEFMAIAEIT